jgi:hypothetical protein
MIRRSALLTLVCWGALFYFAPPPVKGAVSPGGVASMSALDAGHHLQDQHHSGKLHRFGQRRASETVPPPVVLPRMLWADAPDVGQPSTRASFCPLRADHLSELTPRAPPVFAA